MSTFRGHPGFTRFTASQSGRSLGDSQGDHQLQGRFFYSGGEEYRLIEAWRKSNGWRYIVLDHHDRVVAMTSGWRAGDAWQRMLDALGSEGVEIPPRVDADEAA
jgi:hypothetical protein